MGQPLVDKKKRRVGSTKCAAKVRWKQERLVERL